METDTVTFLKKRIVDLECDFITKGPFKDETDSEILIQLWKQSRKRPSFQKLMEKLLDSREDVLKIDFGSGYTYKCVMKL